MDHRRPRWSLSELWWALPRIGKVGHGRAIGVLSIWIWWDRMLLRRWKLQPMRPGGLMRYRLIHHEGPPVTLKDGTTIDKGDPLVELHFDNLSLMRETGESKWTPWETLEQAEADVEALRDMIAEGRLGPVRALYAATLFSGPARRAGFELHPVPHTLTWSLRRYFLIGLIPIYHRDGWKEFDRMRRDRWPAELWMSIKMLDQHQFKTRP